MSKIHSAFLWGFHEGAYFTDPQPPAEMDAVERLAWFDGWNAAQSTAIAA